jgi:hypothetical protein
MAGGTLGLALALAACGPDWQPSWNISSTPAVPGDGLTVQRVTGGDPEFTTLRSESVAQLRESASALLSSRPTSPEAAMTAIPSYAPVDRPGIAAAVAPPSEGATRCRGDGCADRIRPAGSSTPPSIVAPIPPPERARISAPLPPVVAPTPPASAPARVVTIPGQPPGVVSGTGRVQSYTQPGNPAGGVAIQDGGNTTIIQPGGRVTTVPTPR